MNNRIPMRPPAPHQTTEAGGSRSDRDNQQIIDNLRTRHETLKSDRIRTEHDLATHEQALAAARKQAVETFGTDNIEKLREIVRDNYRKNTEATDAYSASIDDIERRLAALPPTV
ncbi:hypothetical protein ACVIGB_000667 [Bradyrhizobium sp. USDA 4341]